MTTAVDSNVLLDIILTGSEFYEQSREAIVSASRVGAVIVSGVAVAEISPNFRDHLHVEQFLAGIGVTYEVSTSEALFEAGRAFRRYSQERVPAACPQCGLATARRQHIIADFLIGAHALIHAGRLLTRDRGYFATYFPELDLA